MPRLSFWELALENQMCHPFWMTDVFPQVEKEIAAEKPTPYLAIPFIVLFGLGLIWCGLIFFLVLLNMANWLPPVTWDGTVYRGANAITEVYQMLVTRGLLVMWPVVSLMVLFGEYQDRKHRAAKA